MATIGYIRVSSNDQNIARQLDGLELDKVFTDRVSGATLNRPALQELHEYVRDGDQIYVHSLDRLARNLQDLQGLVEGFKSKGVGIIFQKENLHFTGEDCPFQNLQLQIIGAVSQFERSMIKERQKEGIQKAKARGAYKGGKKQIDRDKVFELHAVGQRPSDIAKSLGISRMSVYRILKTKPDTGSS